MLRMLLVCFRLIASLFVRSFACLFYLFFVVCCSLICLLVHSIYLFFFVVCCSLVCLLVHSIYLSLLFACLFASEFYSLLAPLPPFQAPHVACMVQIDR